MWNEIRQEAQTTARAPDEMWRESPLASANEVLSVHQARPSRLFQLRERPFLELVNVRGALTDRVFADAFARSVGCRPPALPNTVARSTKYDVLWLGPDEWLVRSNHPATAARLDARLAEALQSTYAAAVDVGSGYTVVEIRGERTRDVLARGCPLDLHPRVLTLGQCAQSHYFKASIVLIPVGGDIFEIVVRRSFADYFCRMILDAAAPVVA